MFDRNSTLSEVLKSKGSEGILARHNVPCLTCPMAELEMDKLRIGDICRMYGIDEENLLEELNRKK